MARVPIPIWIIKRLRSESPVVETDGAYAPGCICKVGKNMMVVQTGEGGLELLEVQLAGKKRMDAGSFLRGYPVAEGSFLQQ